MEFKINSTSGALESRLETKLADFQAMQSTLKNKLDTLESGMSSRSGALEHNLENKLAELNDRIMLLEQTITRLQQQNN